MQFDSKQAAIAYLRDAILEAVRDAVAASTLRLGVHDSAKTNSKYINLYYADRQENPDQDRIPFTVRISDHPIDTSVRFRRNRPNATFYVCPLMDEKIQAQRHERIQHYEALSRQIQTSNLPPEQTDTLVRERNQVADQLLQQQAGFQYTFTGDLAATVAQMRAILMAHLKPLCPPICHG